MVVENAGVPFRIRRWKYPNQSKNTIQYINCIFLSNVLYHTHAIEYIMGLHYFTKSVQSKERSENSIKIMHAFHGKPRCIRSTRRFQVLLLFSPSLCALFRIPHGDTSPFIKEIGLPRGFVCNFYPASGKSDFSSFCCSCLNGLCCRQRRRRLLSSSLFR